MAKKRSKGIVLASYSIFRSWKSCVVGRSGAAKHKSERRSGFSEICMIDWFALYSKLEGWRCSGRYTDPHGWTLFLSIDRNRIWTTQVYSKSSTPLQDEATGRQTGHSVKQTISHFSWCFPPQQRLSYLSAERVIFIRKGHIGKKEQGTHFQARLRLITNCALSGLPETIGIDPHLYSIFEVRLVLIGINTLLCRCLFLIWDRGFTF